MAIRKILVRNGAMWGEMEVGDAVITPGAPAAANAAAGAQNITAAQMLSGAAVFTGAGGAVAYTYPTGTVLDAAFPGMNIGDSYRFSVTNTAAQVATLTTADGLTLTGLVTANAQTRNVIMTKTAAATYTLLHT